MECLVCRSFVLKGDGLEFWGATICDQCEDRLMTLTVDQPEYDGFVRALRALWQRRFQAFRDRRFEDGEHM
ncbi:MAG: hypothetical protein GX199_00095 [Firmicutes bacterium]|nr:hypothetical protein [Bacillota bacterium]